MDTGQQVDFYPVGPEQLFSLEPPLRMAGKWGPAPEKVFPHPDHSAWGTRSSDQTSSLSFESEGTHYGKGRRHLKITSHAFRGAESHGGQRPEATPWRGGSSRSDPNQLLVNSFPDYSIRAGFPRTQASDAPWASKMGQVLGKGSCKKWTTQEPAQACTGVSYLLGCRWAVWKSIKGLQSVCIK